MTHTASQLVEKFQRREGYGLHAWQRALELQAALQVSAPFADRQPLDRWKRFLAAQSPRSLHGFIGKLLKLHPERRML